MKQISALQIALVNAGLNASIWKGQRIYINGLGRDIKAYFIFDDANADAGDDLLSGTALKVFSDCAQSQVWLLNRAKQVKHNLMERMYAASISKVEPTAEWRDVIL